MTSYQKNPDKKLFRLITAPFLIFFLIFSGCSGIGPPTVSRDRFNYVTSISHSWKRQTLLNLLKIRYQDAPVFMDVSSVINQYTIEREVELGFDWGDSSVQSLGGRGLYADRPTITYSPLHGEQFTRRMMKPFPISGIMLLLQAGYPADYILRICVRSINGYQNNHRSEFAGRNADPVFYELLSLLRYLQIHKGIVVQSKTTTYWPTALVMSFGKPQIDVDVEKIRRTKELLGLNNDTREFNVVFGNHPSENNQVAVMTRSMMQVMTEFASFIDVPEKDAEEGRVYVSQHNAYKNQADMPPLIRVKTSPSEPEHSYISVPYRENWFWIDDRDRFSKTSFSFLMMMFSFTETGVREHSKPILTVPTS